MILSHRQPLLLDQVVLSFGFMVFQNSISYCFCLVHFLSDCGGVVTARFVPESEIGMCLSHGL